MYATFTLALGVILIWLYYHLTRNFNYWKNINVPYAKPTLLFGNIYNLLRFRCSVSCFFSQIYNSFENNCVGFFVFDQPFLLIRDPELIKCILIKNYDHFENRGYINAKHDKVSSNIPLVIKASTWKYIRPNYVSLFSIGKIKRILPIIMKEVAAMKCYLHEAIEISEVMEMREVCLKFTMSLATSVVFGLNSNCFQNSQDPFYLYSQKVFEVSAKRAISMSSYLFAPMLVNIFKLDFVESSSSDFLREILFKNMNEREKAKYQRNDIIDLFLQFRKSDDKKIYDDDLLLGQALGILLAAAETTGSTLSYALHCLAEYIDIQNEVRHEIRSTLDRYDQKLCYEATKEMQLLDNVVHETLRMFPPVQFLDRRCGKSFKVPGQDFVIEKGIPVLISMRGLHYDPRYYPNPHIFDPGRFAPANKTNITSGTFLPFGDGPRNCLGSRFAILTIKITLAHILSSFQVETCATTPDLLKFEPKSFVCSPIGGKLDLRLKKLD